MMKTEKKVDKEKIRSKEGKMLYSHLEEVIQGANIRTWFAPSLYFFSSEFPSSKFGVNPIFLQ